MDVVLEGDGVADLADPFPLGAEEGGYYSGLVRSAAAGSLYRFRLDGGEAYPDPASRWQPAGPHGPSQVIDPGWYSWRDQDWRGLRLDGAILYELHIGTFTPEGTWRAASERLPGLADLGINALEVMPVAEFAGRFGWGYDGVDLFAPYHEYGTPDDFRRFVDRAHELGIGVVLDVVYNHFGADGAYVRWYSEGYFHRDRPPNEWGEALNFDGPDSGPVREFFASNAAYWIDEFHLDGLRLDATQAILDDSPEHIIALIARRAREAARGRSILMIGENEPQEIGQIRPVEQGGHGLDALWSDDFHHAAMVALTGRAEAYYSDYSGSPQELVSAVRWGYLFQGQFCHWQQRPRGTPALGIPAARFVTYLENHDQVANTALGRRLVELADPSSLRALTALWLLAPQTPMLFQGQETGSARPFHYFGDFRGELGRKMSEGRRKQIRQFPSLTSPDVLNWLPDPTSRETFLAAKLAEEPDAAGSRLRALFADLIRLRRSDPIFRAQQAERIHGAVVGPHALAQRYFGEGADCRLVLTNLGRDLRSQSVAEPLLAPPPGMVWSLLWSSEDPRYGGRGVPPIEPLADLRISGHATIVLRPRPPGEPLPPAGKPTEGPLPIEHDPDIHPDVLRNRFGA